MLQTLLTGLNTANRDDTITLEVFREDMNLCQQNELVNMPLFMLQLHFIAYTLKWESHISIEV